MCLLGGQVDAGTDVDIWQIGLKVPVTPQFLAPNIPMNAFVDDLQADAIRFWDSLRPYYTAATSLSFVKANVIGVDGFYENKGETFRRDFPERAGVDASNALPSEVAFVVTLLTDVARGLASKGRVYLPAPATAPALTPTGRVGPGYRDACIAAVAQLVRDVGDAPGVDGAAGIGDTSVLSKVREGATRKVTAVRADDTWDTQRRRGNAFVGIKSAVTAI
jgi:hypothetical protein